MARITRAGFYELLAKAFNFFGQLGDAFSLRLLTGDQIFDLSAQFIEPLFGAGVLGTQGMRAERQGYDKKGNAFHSAKIGSAKARFKLQMPKEHTWLLCC